MAFSSLFIRSNKTKPDPDNSLVSLQSTLAEIQTAIANRLDSDPKEGLWGMVGMLIGRLDSREIEIDHLREQIYALEPHMKLSKKQRRELFDMFDGRCAYCGCALPLKGWHADHIEPVNREWWKKYRKPYISKFDSTTGMLVKVPQDNTVTLANPERDVIENFFPSCAPCNLDKHAQSLEGWRKSLEHKIQVLKTNSSPWRHAERFGLVAVQKTKVTFYFEEVKIVFDTLSQSTNPLSSPLSGPSVSLSEGEYLRGYRK